jgi:hypothetical protein
MNAKRDLEDTYVVQVPASLAVHRYDDIEFFDWANGHFSHSLWFCNDIFKSPSLKTAIVKAIKKSSHCNIDTIFLIKK